MIPHEDKVDVISPTSILFIGGGEFLIPYEDKDDDYDDDDDDDDDDHDDCKCKCGATSGLGRKCLNGWKAKKNHHTQFFLDKPTVL